MADDLLNTVKKRMADAVESTMREFTTIRTGRANPDMLKSVQVIAYSSAMPLDQVATVSVMDARTLSIKVWDATLVLAVEKAIHEAAIGLNPSSSEGTMITVPVPQLTQERRRDFIKLAGKYAEQGRVSARGSRRSAIEEMRSLHKNGDMSEDEMHDHINAIQKFTDAAIAKINDGLANKEKDIASL